MKKRLLWIWILSLVFCLLPGCGSGPDQNRQDDGGQDGGKKSFVFGDTSFNAENEEPNVNPHHAYAGWACIRYGVGETLFKINDSLELEPWLAASHELVDDLTWKITLKDGVRFSNGKPCDAAAVMACLDHLVEVHDRARGDLMIDRKSTRLNSSHA